MSLLKFVFVAGLVVGGLGLASGVFRLVEDDPAGGVRLAPRLSKPTLHWYVAKASSALARADDKLKSSLHDAR